MGDVEGRESRIGKTKGLMTLDETGPESRSPLPLPRWRFPDVIGARRRGLGPVRRRVATSRRRDLTGAGEGGRSGRGAGGAGQGAGWGAAGAARDPLPGSAGGGVLGHWGAAAPEPGLGALSISQGCWKNPGSGWGPAQPSPVQPPPGLQGRTEPGSTPLRPATCNGATGGGVRAAQEGYLVEAARSRGSRSSPRAPPRPLASRPCSLARLWLVRAPAPQKWATPAPPITPSGVQPTRSFLGPLTSGSPSGSLFLTISLPPCFLGVLSLTLAPCLPLGT